MSVIYEITSSKFLEDIDRALRESAARHQFGVIMVHDLKETEWERYSKRYATREMTGRTISHYQVLEKLGEGGMGAVYKARDTRLNRFVALKVLLQDKIADPERKRRFLQEARAASALNHPNIIAIYDVLDDAGTDIIVMEYVAGKALDQLLGRRGLCLSDALKYAVQIAGALARAHEAGIIHRDLKPSNVMVSAEGQVKLLDFGLAKLGSTGGGPDAATVDDAAKLRTQTGTLLGTVAYMSPEQAEGKDVDARSDVFSFGALLYEMVSGVRPFQRDSRAATLSAILSHEAKPVSTVQAGVPGQIDWIISHCLRKNPERRLQSMVDARVMLEGVKEESESGHLPAAQLARPRSRWPVVATAAAGLVLVLAGAWWMTRSPKAAAPPALTRLTADSGLTTDPDLSPDGRLLVYASDRSGDRNLDLWVQQLGGGPPIRLTRTEFDESEPSFSPTGTHVAYRSEQEGGGVWVIPALGGEPRRIVPRGRTPRYSPDGTRIAYWTGQVTARGGFPNWSELYVVPSSGGPPQRIASNFREAYAPVWLPDSKHILFAGSLIPAGGVAISDWFVASLDDKVTPTGAGQLLQSQQLPAQVIPVQWMPGGQGVVFTASAGDATNVWFLPISLRSYKAQAQAVRLTSGTGRETRPSLAAGFLVFAALSENTNLWRFPIEANRGRSAGEPRQLTHDAATTGQPSLDRTGTKLTYLSNRSGNQDVWFRDLATGKETPITVTTGNEFRVRISRRGDRVAYSLGNASYVSSTTGGAPETLCNNCDLRIRHWSADDSKLLYQTGFPWRLLSFDFAGRKSVEMARHAEIGIYSSQYSPDDRWVAFNGIGRGVSRVYVAPAKPGVEFDAWIPVSDDKGWKDKPNWSPDGNLIYYFSDEDGYRCLFARRLDPVSKRPQGASFGVRHSHEARQSILNVPLAWLELAIAESHFVTVLGERTGNIWMKPLESRWRALEKSGL